MEETTDQDATSRFPEGTAVWTPYPLDGEQDRARWPWVAGVVEEQCGPDEWSVCLEHPDLADSGGQELTYPVVWRDSSELHAGPQGPCGTPGWPV